MFGQQVQIVITLMILFDGLLVIGSGYLAKYLKFLDSGYIWEIDPVLFTGMILFLMFVNTFAMGRAGMYSDKKPPGIFWMTVRLGTVVAADFAVLLIALYSLKIFDVSRLFFLFWGGSLFVGSMAQRLLVDIYMQRWLAKGFNARQVLIAGSDERAAKVLEAYKQQLSWGHVMAGYLKPFRWSVDVMQGIQQLGSMEDFDQVLQDKSVDEVVFVLPKSGDIRPYMKLCDDLGVSYRLVPSM
ncbi:MAG: hypothetical protein KKB70_10105, partial [Proteobacteria bacterium]|nr:hypothetical protein [Pseudomonadota bacterium]